MLREYSPAKIVLHDEMLDPPDRSTEFGELVDTLRAVHQAVLDEFSTRVGPIAAHQGNALGELSGSVSAPSIRLV